MRNLAKNNGMHCLVSIAQKTYEREDVFSSRYYIPRVGLNQRDAYGVVTLAKLKEIMAECAVNKGWLLIGTHFDTWKEEIGYDRFYEVVDYAKELGFEFKTLKDAFEIWEPAYELKESGTVLPVTGQHAWDDGVITEGVTTYTCAVCGVTRTEGEPPVITSQPSNSIINLGETAKFSISAANGDLSYQWQYSYDLGATWADAGTAGNKTPTLTSAVASATTAKLIYRCKVTNSDGTVYTKNVKFYVRDLAPVINKQPSKPTIKSGETATFNVGVVSATSVTFQWQYSYDNGKNWSDAGTAGNKTATLTSAVASATTARLIYRCKVTNSAGTSYTNNTRFYVSDIAPVVYRQPAKPIIDPGEKATFNVGVSSASSVKYQWEYSYDNGATWANAGTAGAKTSVLTSAPASSTTAKLIYRCKLTNSAGISYTNNTRFYVSDIAPVVYRQPDKPTVNSGETAMFTVGVSSVTSITYQWQYSDDNGATWSDAVTDGSKTASFTSDPASAATAKMIYRCRITNSAGTSYTNNVRFYVRDIAPVVYRQPVDMTVESGERTTFTVGAASASSVKYQWEYSYDNGATWANAGTAGAKTATLTSAPATIKTAKLIYRCRLTNSVGSIYTDCVRMIVS